MTSQPGPTHYEVLGLERDASPEEVKHAYRRLARATHPDAGGNPGLFRLITQAHETLSNPQSRADYDRSISQAPVSTVEQPTTEPSPPAPAPQGPPFRTSSDALVITLVIALDFLVALNHRAVSWISSNYQVPLLDSSDPGGWLVSIGLAHVLPSLLVAAFAVLPVLRAFQAKVPERSRLALVILMACAIPLMWETATWVLTAVVATVAGYLRHRRALRKS